MKKLNSLIAGAALLTTVGCSTLNPLSYFGKDAPVPEPIVQESVSYTYSDVMVGTKVLYDPVTLEARGMETNNIVFPRTVIFENAETADKAQAIYNRYSKSLNKPLAPIGSQEALNFVDILDSTAGESIPDNRVFSSDVEVVGPKVYNMYNAELKAEFERVTGTSQKYIPRQDR